MKGRQTYRLSLVTPKNQFQRPIGAIKNEKLSSLAQRLGESAQRKTALENRNRMLADATPKSNPRGQ